VTIGLAIAALTGISASAERSGATVDNQVVSGSAVSNPGEPERSRPKCPDARRGLGYYRRRHADWLKMRGVRREGSFRAPRNCADAGYLAGVWRLRARRARDRYQRWFDAHVLRDVPFRPGARAWLEAVDEVQRVFPGTASWLLSCSAAEGGHGRWVGYGGQGFSAWLRDSDTVGGPLQFRYSTFKGMFRRSYDHLVRRGFRVPQHLHNPTNAWRSALGQALAGGWARYTGNDNSHWSASWGRGC
jgi:hypothetical protein